MHYNAYFYKGTASFCHYYLICATIQWALLLCLFFNQMKKFILFQELYRPRIWKLTTFCHRLTVTFVGFQQNINATCGLDILTNKDRSKQQFIKCSLVQVFTGKDISPTINVLIPSPQTGNITKVTVLHDLVTTKNPVLDKVSFVL